MHTIHDQEVRAYADVRPHSPLRFPGCYFARYSAESRQGLVIMDDLAARGVTFCHPQRPQTPEQVARRLTLLARHHAMTWNAPAIAPGGRFGWASHIADATYFSTVLVPEVWQGNVIPRR